MSTTAPASDLAARSRASARHQAAEAHHFTAGTLLKFDLTEVSDFW